MALVAGKIRSEFETEPAIEGDQVERVRRIEGGRGSENVDTVTDRGLWVGAVQPVGIWFSCDVSGWFDAYF